MDSQVSTEDFTDLLDGNAKIASIFGLKFNQNFPKLVPELNVQKNGMCHFAFVKKDCQKHTKQRHH